MVVDILIFSAVLLEQSSCLSFLFFFDIISVRKSVSQKIKTSDDNVIICSISSKTLKSVDCKEFNTVD